MYNDNSENYNKQQEQVVRYINKSLIIYKYIVFLVSIEFILKETMNQNEFNIKKYIK